MQLKMFVGHAISADHRLNADSIPLAIDNQSKSSFVHKEAARGEGVQISSCDAAGDKRFCTIHFTASPVLDDAPCAVVFRGAGKVLEAERPSYHPTIAPHVYFQKKAPTQILSIF